MRVTRRVGIAVAAVLLGVPVAGAQSLPASGAPKRALPETTPQPACPSPVTPRAATAPERHQARELALRAKQAAVLGDRAAARDQFMQAAALDPSDADLAYQQARAMEAAGSGADAITAYCRLLVLAPNAPEAAEARERIAAFAPPPRSAVSDAAVERFRAALAAYDARDMHRAEIAFDSAAVLEPRWADLYYDRALVRLAQGRTVAATTDLEQYLRLKPEADDRPAVVARIESLRRAALSPSRALSLGIVVPGGGQFYTGRPARGLLTLGAFGVAVDCAMQQRTTSTTVTQTATDPFGTPYTFESTRLSRDRPCLVPGLIAAALVTGVSAWDAYRYAARRY